MERSLKRYIIYMGLIGTLVVLFCGCRKQTELTPPFTEMSGVQENFMTGNEAPSDISAQIPDPTNAAVVTVTPLEVPTNTPTPIPTNSPTPTPVITDPYDGRFWIGRYAEDTEVLLTKRQIEEQNERNYKAVGTKLTVLSEHTVYTAGRILEMIEEYSLPSRKYLADKELGASGKDALLRERNLSVLREDTDRDIIPEYGILISNTDIRSFPTGKRLTSEVQGRFDYLQETRLLIGEAVLVLHRSSDGAWCFVQAENYCGWIREDAIAYCTRDEMCAVTEAMAEVEKNRIVVVIKGGNYRIGDRDIYLRMGTRLLCGDADIWDDDAGLAADEQERARNTEIITLRLPRKDAFGKLVWEEAGVNRADAEGDVCFVNGYLPYTRANVMQLAVRLLGSPYAWGDAPSFGAAVSQVGDNGMDCSSTVSAVLRCFGFVLPRNTGTQRKMDCVKQDMSGLSTPQRQEVLDGPSS